MIRGAEPAGDDTEYRWWLWRRWEEAGASVTFVMLNPSSASASRDDATIRKCIGFARRWGYGGIDVVNLYGLRATRPRHLWSHPDPVGPGNDRYIEQVAHGQVVVAAWGAHGARDGRGALVGRALAALGEVYCLAVTQSGEPGHPLYIPYDARPIALPPDRRPR